MTFSIKKKPARFSFFGAAGLIMLFLASAYFIQSPLRFVLLFTFGIALALLFFRSFALPYLDTGVEVDGDTIETVTGFGGIISLKISQLDREKSSLSPLGLHLVPRTGEPLFLSATTYSKDDILRLAHYVDLADAGWFQDV